MSKYQPYPDYQPVDIDWIDEIPSHWKPTQIKHIGKLKGGAGFPHIEQGISNAELQFHKVNALGKADPSDNLIDGENTISVKTAERLGAFIFPPKSIVFAKVGAALLLSRIRTLKTKSCIDNNMMGLVVNNANYSIFIKYAMHMVNFDYIVNPGAIPSLNEFQMGNWILPMPSKKEQNQIATFLDHETAKIDTLIEKQQQLIELLKEKRQAVISHAVTKGLNPNAPMKDSGVEWLGEVPEHWNVLRLSRVGKVGQGCSFSHSIQGQTKGDIPWYKVMDMNTDGNEEYMNKSSNYINKKLASRIGAPIFPKGSIIFPRVGAALLTNKRRILSVDSIVDDNIYTFVSRKVKHRFAYRLLQLINMETLCSPGLVPTITFSAINNIYIPLPSLAEQDNIIEYIDRKLSHIDLLIDKTNNAIKLSQERRTALISAAVTGKIDIRSWVASTTSSDTNEAQQEATV